MAQFSFETALQYMKAGGKVTREKWSGEDHRYGPGYLYYDPREIQLQIQYNIANIHHGYSLYVEDLLATDWVFVLEDEKDGKTSNTV